MPRRNKNCQARKPRNDLRPQAARGETSHHTLRPANIYAVKPPQRSDCSPDSSNSDIKEYPLYTGVYAGVLQEELLRERLAGKLIELGLQPLEHTAGTVISQWEMREAKKILGDSDTVLKSGERINRLATIAARHINTLPHRLGQMVISPDPGMTNPEQKIVSYVLQPLPPSNTILHKLRTDVLRPFKTDLHNTGYSAKKGNLGTLALTDILLPVAVMQDTHAIDDHRIYDLQGQMVFPDVSVTLGPIVVTHEVGYPVIGAA